MLYLYTSNSSHYICPRVGYDVFYAMNCTILISKYVYFFLLAGYWIKVKDNGRNFMYLFIMAMYSVHLL